MQHGPLSDPVKTTSFLFIQIVQQCAAAPSRIWFLSLGRNPWSQEPNKLAKLVGC